MDGRSDQKGGGSAVFVPLVSGRSLNFQLPKGVSHPVL